MESVGDYAFNGCTSLCNISLGNNLKTIGNYCFQQTGTSTSWQTLTLPETLTSIGTRAFYESGVSNVSIPSSVTSLGDNCFSNNTKLASVTVGGNCSVIPSGAFENCANLSSITLNEGVTKIADAAFANCTSLVSISIPSTVTQIGTYRWYGSSSSTATELPFYGCSSLKSVRFEDGSSSIALSSHCTSNASYSVSLFASCPLEEVYIGRDIKYIQSSTYSFASSPGYYSYSAFYNQPKLAKVTVSSSVTEIPAYLFYKNSAITITELPNVKAIGDFAFAYCSKMTTLDLGQDLTTVGNAAFYYCTNVTKLTFPDAITTIGDNAFDHCSSVTEITVGTNLKSVGANAFNTCPSFTALILPDGFSTMGEAAFENCTKLTVANLGKSLTALPAKAFKNCIALSEMNIPATVQSIGDQALYNDSTIAVVTMREGLKTIGNEVFWNNSGVRSFVIPGTVTAMGTNCFYGCTSTQVIRFKDGTETLKIDNKSTRSRIIDDQTTETKYRNRYYDYFCDCPVQTLYLGRNLGYTYSNGSSFYDLVDGRFTYVSRASAPFMNCKTLKKLVVGSKVVTLIGQHLFHGCSSLASVDLGSTLQTIYDYAFSDCTALPSVSFPASLVYIKSHAFETNSKLASTTFKESSTHELQINDYAFHNCEVLPAVNFPGQLSVLGNNAYQGCTQLKNVVFNKNEQYKPSLTIGDYTFAQCSLINTLSFPGRLTSIGNYTFSDCLYLTGITFEDSNDEVKLGYGATNATPLFGNSNLSSLYIGRNITYTTDQSHGYSPFAKQRYLTDVRFSQAGTVTYCHDYLLFGVNNCDTLLLPESLTSIGHQTFSFMNILRNIVIPNAVTGIGTYAFYGDAALKSAKLSTSCPWLKEGVFADCPVLQSITIPVVVTKMDALLFRNCTSMKTVKFEDGTDLIEMGYGSSVAENGLFRDCPVETLYLGRWLSYNTEQPSRSPFYSIATLKNLTLGKNLKVVDKYMFSYCTGLDSLYIPDNITSVNMWGFRGCSSLRKVRFSEKLSQIGDYGFSECTQLDNVAFPASMTSTADNSFSNCTSLKSLDLGESLLVIGPSAFENDTKISGITMPETLYGLGVASFKNCAGLPYVEVRGITSVGKEAFQNCTGLQWISLSDKTTSLGENAFDGCTGIKYVKSYATTPPEGLVNFPSDVEANGTLFIPEDTDDNPDVYGDYQFSPTWENWLSIKRITENTLLTSLTLNKSDVSLEAGQSVTLQATVGPDGADNKNVDWKSDDETIATVTPDGVVTAVKVGQTTIHAIANDGGGAKALCAITVVPTMVNSITLSNKTLEIRKNHTAQLTATVLPANATNADFAWSSTNENIAKVDEEGIVSAVSPGSVVIKATAKDGSLVEGTCEVTVLPVLKGDSNDDSEINIVDAVNTVNYILGKNPATFAFEAADVNSDGSISVSDATGTISLVLQQSLSQSSDIKSRGGDKDDFGSDYAVLSMRDEKTLNIALSNSGNYVAMQVDILLPVNANDVEIQLGEVAALTHQLICSKLNARTLRVVVYSMNNDSFVEGSAIFALKFKTAISMDDICMTNAVVSDAEANGSRLKALDGEPTSIAERGVSGNGQIQTIAGGIAVTGEVDAPVFVYTVSGILVKSLRLVAETANVKLDPGVYLVKVNDTVTKVTVK